MPKKTGLGRGLNALFSENATEELTPVELRVAEIQPNPAQPRKNFEPEALSELAESITLHGVLQPLLVRPAGELYQIVAGERRWRAARQAGLQTVPVIIRELDDGQAMELALIENLQREDLNPVEEAEGYRQLMEEFGLTQEEVASRVNKSRPAVTNALRLLGLPLSVLQMVRAGQISAGHGRALLAVKEESEQKRAAGLALSGASVREIEKLAAAKRTSGTSKKDKPEPQSGRDTFYTEVQMALSAEIGRKVAVTGGQNGRGKLEVEFYSKEDLADMANRLAGK